MDTTIEIDLGQAAHELGLPVESVQNTVALLDEGNTVPFITRYRKDLGHIGEGLCGYSGITPAKSVYDLCLSASGCSPGSSVR